MLLQWNLNTCLCVKFEGVGWNESPRVRSLPVSLQYEGPCLVLCRRFALIMYPQLQRPIAIAGRRRIIHGKHHCIQKLIRIDPICDAVKSIVQTQRR